MTAGRWGAGVLVLCLMMASGCSRLPFGSDDTTLPDWAVEPGDVTVTVSDPGATSSSAPGNDSSASSDQPTSAGTDSAGMIFPLSDTELIRWSDLIGLSLQDLSFARNDFYARAGYSFEKESYRDHYASLSWYKVNPDFSADSFSDIQKANILLIQIAEARAGNGLLYLSSGTKLDFDQDGALEGLEYGPDSDGKFAIRLEDGSDERVWHVDIGDSSGKVYIGDVNSSDGILDLFTDGTDESGQSVILSAGLTSQGFLMRGSIPGACDTASVNGEGVVITHGRMLVLMNRDIEERYVLNASGALTADPAIYYSLEDYPATTIVDLPLRSTQDNDAAPDITVPAGTAVRFVQTDNAAWVEVRADDVDGWLFLVDGVTVADLGLTADKVFAGLPKA